MSCNLNHSTIPWTSLDNFLCFYAICNRKFLAINLVDSK